MVATIPRAYTMTAPTMTATNDDHDGHSNDVNLR